MGFLDKLRASMARFMSGRYGADQLSMAMVIAALVVSIKQVEQISTTDHRGFRMD